MLPAVKEFSMVAARCWQCASALLVAGCLVVGGCGGSTSSDSGAGGESGSGGGEVDSPCESFVPCEGDPIGQWEAESICRDTSVGWALASESSTGGVRYLPLTGLEECAGGATSEVSIDGTLTVAQSGDYSAEFTVSHQVDVAVSRDCADALFGKVLAPQGTSSRALSDSEYAAFCSDPAQFDDGGTVYAPVVAPGGALKQCALDGDTCRCSASASGSYVDTGTFSLENGAAADSDGDPRQYCAKGTTLAMHAPPYDGSGGIVLFPEGDPEALAEWVITFRRARD
jgi:hypothetical protein